jgi:hypothetical protein
MVRSNPMPKAGAGHRAIAVQIAVPDVVFLVDAALRRAGVEQVEPLIALEALPDEGPGLIAPYVPEADYRGGPCVCGGSVPAVAFRDASRRS